MTLTLALYQRAAKRTLATSTAAFHWHGSAKASNPRAPVQYLPTTRGLFAVRRSNFAFNSFRALSIDSEQGLSASESLLCTDPFEECWTSDCWSINDDGNRHIDMVLGTLASPAPQSYYVLRRALKEAPSPQRAFETCYYLIKADYQIIVRADLGFDDHCLAVGVDWNVVPKNSPLPESGWVVFPRPCKVMNGIQIAKKALSLVEALSEVQEPVNEKEILTICQELRTHLNLTLGTDIRGRTCADTAFTLALAGVTDEDLYDTLSKITLLELRRVGGRKSRRGKDILQIVEKLAASGVRGGNAEEAFRVAAGHLAEKGPHLDPARDDLATPHRFGLLSQRPLIWLWRYSSSLVKSSVKKNSASSSRKSTEWIEAFADTTRPLVIDVGCGLGVSLLGLATSASDVDHKKRTSCPLNGMLWSECNFVGGDLSLVTTRFAQGIAKRWGLCEKLQFPMLSTEILLEQVLTSYPGQTALILVQFPTPYRLDDSTTRIGNTQLPSSVESGFMISQGILDKIAAILAKQKGSSPRARLLVQSNCEDVAVKIRSLAQLSGLRCIPAAKARMRDEIDDHSILPQRTQKWIDQGGERAIGPEWWAESLLPPKCATETEVACDLKQTSVHRCLLELDTD